MGIFGSKYKDILIPGCAVKKDASTDDRLVLNCNTEKVVGDKTYASKGDVEAIIEKGKIYFYDDGGLPAPTLEELKRHIQRNLTE